MKILIKILLALLLSFNFLNVYTDENLTESIIETENSITNSYIDGFISGSDFKVSDKGLGGIANSIIKIALDLKNVFFIIASLIFLILIIKLLFSEKTDEEVTKFKKGIIWISSGIIIMQVAFHFISIIYQNNISSSQTINADLGLNIIDGIIEPLTNMLLTGIGFFFVIMMIYSFYLLVTANGDEEQVKSGKMTVLYSIIGYIVIKVSDELILGIYGQKIDKLNSIMTTGYDTSDFVKIIIDVINWMNAFLYIIIVFMIIYAGFNVLFSMGDEEKVKSAKKSIIYVIVGSLIVSMNYLILTFFIEPSMPI